MATLAHSYVPVEVYLRSSYEPDAEYVDGVIEERPVGEYDHSSWQGAILKWFWQHEKEWNVRVRAELRVQVARTRFRVRMSLFWTAVSQLSRSLHIRR